MFAADLRMFDPSISGLRCFLKICDDYTAEHEIAFNGNKAKLVYVFKNYKQLAPSNVFLNGVGSGMIQIF